ncbi:CsiV family protein [Marinobacter sp.]|uniref:CsiV family protein n=1 Tax=Marinobacter sp. TaxID=50741 RepID=UPI00356A3EE8
MQIDGIRWCRYPTRAILAALLLSFSVTGAAQQPDRDKLPLEPGAPVPDDYYRAEIIILERIIEPEAINERMSDRTVDEATETEEILWSVGQGGTTETTLDLAPQEDLHLASAATRLERSGKYRVLVAAGWYEAFPPDYEGTPLRVEAGDWIDDASTRSVEGHITIDRQRYLHVDVHLNHWQRGDEIEQPVADIEADIAVATPSEAPEPDSPDSTSGSATTGDSPDQPLPLSVESAPLELLTWIRETRRMRSEEIHFLDSPTIGVLVFFKKIEATE